MQGLPSPDALLTLHDLGVEWIVSDEPLTPDPDLAETFVERAQFSDQRVYQLVWSPAAESMIDDAAAVVPPEPGPAPFGVGESATYRVRWTSGPMRLPAGEATMSVEPPQEPAAYRFVVSAATASWVSSFYTANVRLETTATDRIVPLQHRQTVAEDRRTVERQIEYDADRRQIRMTTGGATIALPLTRDARDPISMLFYVRTLPLETGGHVVLPLTDNGRRSLLELTVGGIETVTLDGRAWAAVKLTPRVTGRVERQAPLEITTWLSTDARRIPLIFEVSAAFGTARAELASYREGTKMRRKDAAGKDGWEGRKVSLPAFPAYPALLYSAAVEPFFRSFSALAMLVNAASSVLREVAMFMRM